MRGAEGQCRAARAESRGGLENSERANTRRARRIGQETIGDGAVRRRGDAPSGARVGEKLTFSATRRTRRGGRGQSALAVGRGVDCCLRQHGSLRRLRGALRRPWPPLRRGGAAAAARGARGGHRRGRRGLVGRVTVVERNFHFKLNVDRHAYHIQSIRRSIMARSRNYLLSSALQDEMWVLWIDSDLTDLPETMIQDLLAYRKPIVVPNCFTKTYSGRLQIYDRNSWAETPQSRSLSTYLPARSVFYEGYALNTRRLLLGDMYPSSKELVPLDGVGGTVLLVLADAHRDGCIFSAVPFRHAIETEALGVLCREMGYIPYGAPNYLIFH